MATVNKLLRERGYNLDGSPIVGFVHQKEQRIRLCREPKESKEKTAKVGEQRNQLPVEQPPKADVGASPTLSIIDQPLVVNKVEPFWKQDFVSEPDRGRQLWVETKYGKFLAGELWAQKYLGHRFVYKVAPFQRQIWEHLCFDDRFCLAVFRGSGKSEVFRHYVLFCLLNQIWKDVLILSKTASLAVSEWSAKLNTELYYNQAILKDYGHLIHPMQKDAEDEKIFACGSKIAFKGKDYQTRGYRFDLVGVDDPETFADVQSETARLMLEGFFLQDLSNALALGRNQVVVIGNIFDRLCLVNKIVTGADGKFSDYVSLSPAAEYKEGDLRKSIWESAWPIEKLDKKKAEIGWRQYQCEFMNNPVSSEYAIIQQEWVRYYDKFPVESKWEHLIACDPAGYSEAGTNKDRDYTSVCLAHRAISGSFKSHIFIDKWVRLRRSQLSVAEFIADLYRFNRPADILVEKVGLSSLQNDLREVSNRKMLYLPVKIIIHGRHTGDLRQRVEAITAMFEEGYIHFRGEHKVLVEEELLGFPHADHDDAVSSLEMILTWFRKRKPVGSRDSDLPESNILNLRRDFVTGRPL